MSQLVRKILTAVALALAVFLVSVLVVNWLRPLFRKELGERSQEELLQQLEQTGTPGTERVLCIDSNEEALLWRLRMIAAAKESIVLTTFDFRTDAAGLDVMAALYDAAERGVQVRLLVDGVYQLLYLRDNRDFYSLCAHENVEAKFYNPINLGNIYSVNYRMHDKYLMIDDRMYLLGGRNTSRTFLGTLHRGSNIDREVLVYQAGDRKGESFLQLESYFTKIWEEPASEPVTKKVKASLQKEEFQKFSERMRCLEQEYGDLAGYDEWFEATLETNRITLLSNGTGDRNKEPRILAAMELLAAQAQEITMQTPYVICNKEMYDTLQLMGEQAKLSIYLNAVEKGSNPWGCTDYLNNKKKILQTGATVYEVMNDHAVHTKTVLFDDNLAMIGSFNYDMRSAYLDTELMLVIESEALNRGIRTQLAEYREKSIEVHPDGTEQMGSLYQEKPLEGSKKLMYAVLRVIIRPFRHLL